MKRLNLDVDDSLFSDFKAHCASRGRTIREEVLSLITYALKKGAVPLEASDASEEVAVPPFLRSRKKQEGEIDRTEYFRRIARRRFESKPLLERFEDLHDLRLSENAMWLALLIDTEGAMGWYESREKVDRINEGWRYQYDYVCPYIGVDMRKLESERTIEKAGRLMGKAPISRVKEPYGETVEVVVEKGRAVAVAIYIKPYLDKFGRLAELLTTLFKHRTHAPADKFNQALINLFDHPLSPKQTNEALLRVSETAFNKLMEEAERQADLHLT